MSEMIKSKRSNRTVYIVLMGLVLLGFLLRIYNLGGRALHNDESLQLNGIQTQSFSQLIQHCTHVDMHPPLSYLLEKMVYHYTSDVVALRFVSVIFGVLAIPVLFWALYTLVGKRIALIVAALSAVSYELIWYSRELRDYIFFYLFVVAAFGFFVRILQDTKRWPSWGNLVGFILMNILATYSHFNTYLTWPIYGAIFLLWEVNGKKLNIRWRYVGALFLSAVTIILMVAPTFGWFAQMRNVQGQGSLRPGIVGLYKMFSPFGYGMGWRFVMWVSLLVIGIFAVIRRYKKVGVVLLVWAFLPIIAYVYIVGVPPKFIHLFYRYMIFLQLGFISLMALGIEQIALWITRHKQQMANYVCATIVLLTVIMMLPVFNAYYGLTATDRLYNEIGDTLKELSPRCLFLDNYYEMQFMRHYLPEDMTIAFPPIFNNDEEYQRLDAHGFTRKALEADSLLVFFDAGNIRRRSRAGRDVGWLEKHFVHKREFVNKKGVYLYKRGLNLFAMHDFDKRVDRIYYNNIEDLSDVVACNTNGIIAFSPDWCGLTIMGFDGKWKFYRVAGKESNIYFSKNKNGELALQLHGCSNGQIVSIYNNGQQIAVKKLVSGPLTGFDYRSKKQFRQYIPFASLLKKSNGVLNLPLAVNLPMDIVKLDVASLPTGINKIVLKSNKGDGIICIE